jgi:hypothetical protein
MCVYIWLNRLWLLLGKICFSQDAFGAGWLGLTNSFNVSTNSKMAQLNYRGTLEKWNPWKVEPFRSGPLRSGPLEKWTPWEVEPLRSGPLEKWTPPLRSGPLEKWTPWEVGFILTSVWMPLYPNLIIQSNSLYILTHVVDTQCIA